MPSAKAMTITSQHAFEALSPRRAARPARGRCLSSRGKSEPPARPSWPTTHTPAPPARPAQRPGAAAGAGLRTACVQEREQEGVKKQCSDLEKRAIAHRSPSGPPLCLSLKVTVEGGPYLQSASTASAPKPNPRGIAAYGIEGPMHLYIYTARHDPQQTTACSRLNHHIESVLHQRQSCISACSDLSSSFWHSS
jgi:hypothetical protein